MSNLRLTEDGKSIEYDTTEQAMQGYIDEMAYGGMPEDAAISFHEPSCEIPDDGLFQDEKCTCLPIRFRLGDIARVGAKHAASIIDGAGFGAGGNVQDAHHEREEDG